MIYRIRNWEKFQHYKKRNPPWVKLHFAILTSPDWVMLDDASRLLAIVCILLASRNGGKIDGSPAGIEYMRRVANLDKKPNLQPLIKTGFLIGDKSSNGTEVAELINNNHNSDTSLNSSNGVKERVNIEKELTETETETESKHLLAHNASKMLANASMHDKSSDFETFWLAYPKKVGKGAARKAWQKIKPSQALLHKMLQAIDQQKQSDQWNRDGGQYIPNPATWLNQQRWEDDLSATIGTTSKAVLAAREFLAERSKYWEAEEKEVKS